jgi:hypothetical protein
VGGGLDDGKSLNSQTRESLQYPGWVGT